MSNFTDFIGGSGGGTFSDEYVQKTLTAGSDLAIGDKIILTDSNQAVKEGLDLSAGISYSGTFNRGTIYPNSILTNGVSISARPLNAETYNYYVNILSVNKDGGTSSASSSFLGQFATNESRQDVYELRNEGGTCYGVVVFSTYYYGTDYPAYLLFFKVTESGSISILRTDSFGSYTAYPLLSVTENYVLASRTNGGSYELFSFIGDTVTPLQSGSVSSEFGISAMSNAMRMVKLNDTDDRYMLFGTDTTSYGVLGAIFNLNGTTSTKLANFSVTVPNLGSGAPLPRYSGVFRRSDNVISMLSSGINFGSTGYFASFDLTVDSNNQVTVSSDGRQTFSGTSTLNSSAPFGWYGRRISDTKFYAYVANSGSNAKQILIYDIPTNTITYSNALPVDMYSYGISQLGVGVSEDSDQIYFGMVNSGNYTRFGDYEYNVVSANKALFFGETIKVTETIGYSNQDASKGGSVTISVKKGMPESYGLPTASFIQSGDDYYPVKSVISYGVAASDSTIKSIQQGWYSLTSNSGSTTITPVDADKSVINFLGSSPGDTYARGLGSISGFDGTTIDFYRVYSAGTTYIGWQVIEYA